MLQQFPRPRGGRKPDEACGAFVLDATIDILAEIGVERMTMDMVALRAGVAKATVYRRWPSKKALALDALASLAGAAGAIHDLPDTGSLRGDVLALFKPLAFGETERKLRAAAGMVTLATQERRSVGFVTEALLSPWIDAIANLIRRSIERGEVAADIAVNDLASVLPNLAAFRTMCQGLHLDAKWIIDMTDAVLPAAALAHRQSNSHAVR